MIPRTFTTSFEASVARHAAFVCRADIRAQINHRERGGRHSYKFGQQTPLIRLMSGGPIVIDNSPDAAAEDAVKTLG